MNWNLSTFDHYNHCSSQSWALYKFILFKFKKFLLLLSPSSNSLTCIEVSASRDAFITLKDHKPDFANNPTCRFINPTKSEFGIINKHILDNINKEMIKVTKANLWRSTSNIIDWIKAIPNKFQHAFIHITFDVCDFYPSISEQLLTKTLDYLNPDSRTSLRKTAISSRTRRNHCCITKTRHGKRKTPAAYSTWRWAHMTEPRHAN